MSSSLPPQQHHVPRAHLPLRQKSFLTEQARKGKLRQLQPNTSSTTATDNTDHEHNSINFLKSSSVPVDNQEQVSMLEKRVDFLRTQHTDTLAHLHGELDRLKAENRDLNFKMVMCRCGGGISREDRSRQAQRRKATPKAKEKSVDNKQPQVVMEGELNNLRCSLEKANKRNSRLMKVVEKMMQRSVMSDSGSTGHPRQRHLAALKRGLSLPTKATLSPEEYEDIIGRLEQINRKQADEIKLLKEDFQDLLLSDDQPSPLSHPSAVVDQSQYYPQGMMTTPQGTDEDLLYISPSHSRVTFPFIPIKQNHQVTEGGYHDSNTNPSVRLPPLASKPISLVSNGRHRKLMGGLQQRNKLSTYPR